MTMTMATAAAVARMSADDRRPLSGGSGDELAGYDAREISGALV